MVWAEIGYFYFQLWLTSQLVMSLHDLNDNTVYSLSLNQKTWTQRQIYMYLVIIIDSNKYCGFLNYNNKAN